MTAEARDIESPFNLYRLKYVTEHLASRLDLTFVVLGVMFLVQSTEEIWKIPAWFTFLASIGLLIAFAYIPKYHEKRFGTVEAKTPSNKGVVVFVIVMVVLFVWGRQIEAFFSPLFYRANHRIHSMMSDPTEQIELYPPLLWIFTFAGSLQRCSRSLDPYEPYFAFLGMASCITIATYPLFYPTAKQLVLWRFLNAASFGLTFIALGLYSHFTLVRLLPKKSRGEGR